MKGTRCPLIIVFVLASVAWSLAQVSGGSGRGAGQAREEGPPAPVPGSASVRTMSAWGRIRTAAPGILGWNLSVPGRAFRQEMWLDAAIKADGLGVSSIEGSSAQKVSLQIPKELDANLAPGEVRYVRERLIELSLRMPVYSIKSLGADEAAARKVLEFAKEVGVETVAVEQTPRDLGVIDRLANDLGVNVAISGAPQAVLAALQGRGDRVGASADIGKWMQEGIKPADGVAMLKNRLMVLRLSDRSSLGSGGRAVALGSGAAGIPELLSQMEQMQLKTSIVVEGIGTGDIQPDLARSLEGFEKAAQAAMARRVGQLALKTPDKGPEQLTPEQRDAVRAGLPSHPAAKPKKARKLLVLDANIGYGGPRGGHITNVAGGNMAIAEFAKATGAFEPVFSNDMENLKYPKIKEFDAIFLNNTVGMLFADPGVRDGLLRFVREGGGLAGTHGASHASMDWPEFREMLGAVQGTHREATEVATIKIDDPDSPITAAFGGKEFTHQDEFYRFTEGTYSRDKLHVLFSMDVQKTDMNQGRGCSRPCGRADADYALAWIRSYGKGRVFFTPLGHTYAFYVNPQLSQFFFAAMQFVLGDLEADTTPSSKLRSATGNRREGLAAGVMRSR